MAEEQIHALSLEDITKLDLSNWHYVENIDGIELKVKQDESGDIALQDFDIERFIQSTEGEGLDKKIIVDSVKADEFSNNTLHKFMENVYVSLFDYLKNNIN